MAQGQNVSSEQTIASVLFPNQASDIKTLKYTQSGRVKKIIDAHTILLQNSDIIRLTSITISDRGDLGGQAFLYLQNILPAGTQIMLYQPRNAKKGQFNARVNRMGHQLAHVVIKQNNIWVQGSLLSRGLAYVDLSLLSTELFADLYEAESIAMDQKRGMWGDEDHKAIQAADNVKIGAFQIIEGRVLKVASTRNNIFLNFGENWKEDFTIMITPKLRQKLSREGINLFVLEGQKIRVRGWVRDYNGPLIELDTPEHLQIL